MSCKKSWNAEIIRYCNCAGCKINLVGLSNADEDLEYAHRKKIPVVAALVKGRPYCRACLRGALND